LDQAEHVDGEEDAQDQREWHHGRQAPGHGAAVPRVTRPTEIAILNNYSQFIYAVMAKF
jgi:hypothetical protein